MGQIICPEVWVTNYQSALRKSLEKRIYHLQFSGSLKSSLFICLFIHLLNYMSLSPPNDANRHFT